MANEELGTFGGWINAAGTIISALASTPPIIEDSAAHNEWNLIGNVLQATGNAVEADVIEHFSLTKLKNEIQAVGNVTVIIGILIIFNKDDGVKLVISGNWIQALGASLAFVDELQSEHNVQRVLKINGYMLQAIGNSLQAIGGIYGLRNKEHEGKYLNMTGSWIQATGAIITAIA